MTKAMRVLACFVGCLLGVSAASCSDDGSDPSTAITPESTTTTTRSPTPPSSVTEAAATSHLLDLTSGGDKACASLSRPEWQLVGDSVLVLCRGAGGTSLRSWDLLRQKWMWTYAPASPIFDVVANEQTTVIVHKDSTPADGLEPAHEESRYEAIGTEDGQPRWTHAISGTSTARGPQTAEGMTVIALPDGSAKTLEVVKNDGTVLWSMGFNPNDPIVPIGQGQWFIVTNSEGREVVVKSETGEVLDTAHFEFAGTGSFYSTIYWNHEGTYNLATGEVGLPEPTGKDRLAEPFGDGLLIERQGAVGIVDIEWRERWSIPNSVAMGTLKARGDRLYLDNHSGQTIVVDPATGTEIGRVPEAPQVANTRWAIMFEDDKGQLPAVPIG